MKITAFVLVASAGIMNTQSMYTRLFGSSGASSLGASNYNENQIPYFYYRGDNRRCGGGYMSNRYGSMSRGEYDRQRGCIDDFSNRLGSDLQYDSQFQVEDVLEGLMRLHGIGLQDEFHPSGRDFFVDLMGRQGRDFSDEVQLLN